MTLFGVIVRATGIHGQDDAWEVVLECVLTFGTGAIAGRLMSGGWRAALALGTASLALTFAQAGPIPVMNSGRAASLFAALAVVYLVCVIALVRHIGGFQVFAMAGVTTRGTGAWTARSLT
jgi:hypothetical protein